MHNHLRRATAAAFAASALALLAACGDGAADGKAATPRDETSAASASASPTPSEPAAEPLSSREAKKALLADGDLPQGWKRDPELIIDASGGAPEDLLAKPADATCLPLVDLFNTGRVADGYKANAQAVFLKGDSIFGHDVSAYAADKAESVMTALGKAVTGCGTFDSEYGGGKAKVTTKPLKVTEAGDETLGFSVKVDLGDEVVDVEYGVVRDGANITSVQHNWVDDHDADAFTKGLAKAAEKLSAAAGN
ncbi:hypothetical protein [Streptomyces sp. NPDC018693]|uniref:hypothetical protein n=1 Tax=unclassified Streptomyces TaxID=2593676 RepID=UPI0037AAF2D3